MIDYSELPAPVPQCKGQCMEWFINACAVILLACVTTVMVSLTLAGVAFLWSKVRKEIL
jgi:hypothetical protein